MKLVVTYQGPPLTPTTTVLSSSANPSTNGQSVVFTATLRANGKAAADATGNFAFVVDGVPVASPVLVGGSASYTNSPFSEGRHPILASYVGNARYASSMASLIQNCGVPVMPTYSMRADGWVVATCTNGSGIWVVPDGVSSVEVLVVGGGGGSAASFSSGSGAGGMYYTGNYPVTPGSSVQVEVGAGGVGADGARSVFDKVIAYGGTPGGDYTDGGDQGGYSVDGELRSVPGNPGYHYSPMDGNWCTGGGAGSWL